MPYCFHAAASCFPSSSELTVQMHFLRESSIPSCAMSRATVLMRFDCDLSRDVHDPEMKKHCNYFTPDVYYKLGLSKAQRQRLMEANEALRKGGE